MARRTHEASSLGELLMVYMATEVGATGWVTFVAPRDPRADELLIRFTAGEPVGEELTVALNEALDCSWPGADDPTVDLVADQLHELEELGARILEYVRLLTEQARERADDEIPIVVAPPEELTQAAAADSGSTQVIDELARLQRDTEWLRAHALDDPASGLRTRQYLEERLREEISRNRRDGGKLGVGVIELRAAEEPAPTLREVAKIVRDTVRAHDVVCRGSESSLVILFPGAGAEHGRSVLERVRQRLVEATVTTLEVALGFAAAGTEDRPLARELLAKAELDIVRI